MRSTGHGSESNIGDMVHKAWGQRYIGFTKLLLPAATLPPLVCWLMFLLLAPGILKIDLAPSIFVTFGWLAAFSIVEFVLAYNIEPSKRITTNCLDKAEFVARAKKTAEFIGYHLYCESDSVLTFEPTGEEAMSPYAIFVRFGDKVAEVSGPFVAVRKFVKQAEYLFENTLMLDQV